ncbi:MAG TPA: lipopolysaccharide assembly protein LapA domain-containing protein [Clostridiaceae bacterium]
MRIGFIISLIFAIIVALFGIQNAEIISVNFFSTKVDISLALIIFVSAISGAIIVTLLGLQKEFSLSRGNKRLAKKSDKFEAEIENFKNENMALTVENETFKSQIATLATNNETFNDEIKALKIEIIRLDPIVKSEPIL